MENLVENKKYLLYKGIIFVIALCIGLAIGSMHSNWRENETKDIIALNGHGEVSAVPDIATISFSILQDGQTIKEAQDAVAKIEKKSLDFLRSDNIADKDIKATNISFYPRYDYQYYKDVTCGALTCPPRPSKQVIVGYTSSENINIKVRNTDDVGKIVAGLGTLPISDLNGPNFAIDNEDGLKAGARKLAIEDAKAKAKVLAKDLGVRLGKISSFSESANYPMPMYAKGVMADSVGAAAPAEIPKGENLISSDVTVTYEIR